MLQGIKAKWLKMKLSRRLSKEEKLLRSQFNFENKIEDKLSNIEEYKSKFVVNHDIEEINKLRELNKVHIKVNVKLVNKGEK